MCALGTTAPSTQVVTLNPLTCRWLCHIRASTHSGTRGYLFPWIKLYGICTRTRFSKINRVSKVMYTTIYMQGKTTYDTMGVNFSNIGTAHLHPARHGLQGGDGLDGFSSKNFHVGLRAVSLAPLLCTYAKALRQKSTYHHALIAKYAYSFTQSMVPKLSGVARGG